MTWLCLAVALSLLLCQPHAAELRRAQRENAPESSQFHITTPGCCWPPHCGARCSVRLCVARSIWHDLSKGVHGATATPRAIYEHGDRGWEADEAATLSIFLDHFELDYTFFSNNDVVEPPPYR